MCGICGVIDMEGHLVPSDLIRKMCHSIRHRGPDDEGIWVDGSIGLGIRRLSIIDLHTGRQPIFNESGTIIAVINGEIYNHHSLRKSLQNIGHVFHTNTDVEVIVHLYEEYGDKCVEKLNGMFAFALWDKTNKKLLLARDRLGIKPLYYYDNQKGKIVFASEIKSIIQDSDIVRKVNLKALHYYLTYGYVPAPLTIFQNIFKLSPAQIFSIDCNRKRILTSYWDMDFNDSTKDINNKEYYLSVFEEKFLSSVESHLMSDVPIGAFLSGGLDSSILVSLMSHFGERKIKTFSIGFEDINYSELPYARIVARKFRTDHHEEIVFPKAMEILPKLVWHFDEPFADASAIPMYYLSKMASSQVKVALSGDGGDELFGGYDRHRRIYFSSMFRIMPKIVREKFLNKLLSSNSCRGLKHKLKIMNQGSLSNDVRCYHDWVNIISDDYKNELYSDNIKNIVENYDACEITKYYMNHEDSIDSVNKFLYMDSKSYLPDDLLMKADKAGMAHSLEIRIPFLDHDFVEWTTSIPIKYKLRRFTSKYLLREYAKRQLPSEIYNRAKKGFSVPLNNWFNKSMFGFAEEIFSDSAFKNRGYFSHDAIEQMLTRHKNCQADYSKEIWALMFLEVWHKKFID